MQDLYKGYQRPAEAWAKARGLRTIDYNGFLLLVRSSVESVAGAIAGEGVRWEPDVLGKEIVRRKDAVFVYRLPGDSRPAPRRSHFTSTRRTVVLHRIRNIYDFVEHDAFDPGFDFDYFSDHVRSPYSFNRVPPGEIRATVVNPGITTAYPGDDLQTNVPPIERIDHLFYR